MSTRYVTTTNSQGIGLATGLTILFVALKLTHVISWPWVWVLAPLWISFLLGIFLLLVGLFALIIVKVAFGRRRYRATPRHWNGRVIR